MTLDRSLIHSRFPQPDEAERRAALAFSLTSVEAVYPELASKRTFVRWQMNALLCSLAVFGGLAAVSPRAAAGLAASILTLLYIAAMTERAIVFIRGMKAIEVERPPVPPAVPDEELPVYTILMPAYDEPEVISSLVRATTAIDYPADRLELLLLLEEDDDRTLAVLLEQDLPPQVRVLLVPPQEPRTKPKACNYGLYFARGEFVTIYDAEDRPEPMQLRDAVAAFRGADENLVCLQARLDYYNTNQNLITRWFTVEYATWFGVFLPGLQALRLPIPLGGTSNHMRAVVLRAVGAWDAYNVTEDADLGLRLARSGYVTGVLESVTYEEANSDLVNWIRQRSRWYKGYLQTWLVHFREPRRAVRELGKHGALSVTLLIGGTPIVAAANLFTWVCTLVFVIGVPQSFDTIFPAPTVYIGLFCALVGNASIVYVSVLALTQTLESRFAWVSLIYPLYWILMAIAAVKGCWQLFVRPSYWEKTAHGLVEAEAAP